jgi:hypothetical protein
MLLFSRHPCVVADEVGAHEGDILEGLVLDGGWWRVQHLGKFGLFPGNYVEVQMHTKAVVVPCLP